MSTDINILAVRILTTLWHLEETIDPPLEEIVNSIFGLTSSIKDYDEDDFIVYGENDRELKVESATGYLVDRLQQAYVDKRLREQYLEELHNEEKWELLAKVH
jgi:hypothetical protein